MFCSMSDLVWKSTFKKDLPIIIDILKDDIKYLMNFYLHMKFFKIDKVFIMHLFILI